MRFNGKARHSLLGLLTCGLCLFSNGRELISSREVTAQRPLVWLRRFEIVYSVSAVNCLFHTELQRLHVRMLVVWEFG